MINSAILCMWIQFHYVQRDKCAYKIIHTLLDTQENSCHVGNSGALLFGFAFLRPPHMCLFLEGLTIKGLLACVKEAALNQRQTFQLTSNAILFCEYSFYNQLLAKYGQIKPCICKSFLNSRSCQYKENVSVLNVGNRSVLHPLLRCFWERPLLSVRAHKCQAEGPRFSPGSSSSCSGGRRCERPWLDETLKNCYQYMSWQHRSSWTHVEINRITDR